MLVQERMKDPQGDPDGVGDLAIQFSVHLRIRHVPRRFCGPLRGSAGYRQRGGNQQGSAQSRIIAIAPDSRFHACRFS